MKENIIDIIVLLILLIALLGAFNVIPTPFSDFLIQLLISAIPGIIISFVSAKIVKGVTGDLLKQLSINYEFHGIKISVTIFVIATFLVKILFFGL